MENQNVSKQDCSCSDGCCTPQKKTSKLWSKIIFLIIVLAAGVIIMVKLINKPEKCCDKKENATCCPHSKTEKL